MKQSVVLVVFAFFCLKCETLQAKSSFFDNANSKLRGINLFPIDDDVALGKQVYDEINSDDSYTKYS